MSLRRIAFGGVCLAFLIFTSTTRAQDAAGTSPPTTQSPAESAPAASPAADPTAAASPELAEFERLLAQWKTLLGELAKLSYEYKESPPEERKPIEEKYAQLLVEGNALELQLQTAAEQAYAAGAGDRQSEVGDYLAQLMLRKEKFDDFEGILRLTKLLEDHEFWNPRIYSYAGMAAFNNNEFDLAETYFNRAKKANALEDAHSRLLEMVPIYRDKWAAEQKLREAEATADDLPRVELKTSKGTIVIELFENEAPQAVANFLTLVESGFYNGTSFHRVLQGFMAQGGDPKGDGTGGPGYSIACECYEPDARMHFRGTLSMAHAGRDSGGSQFFLTFVPTAHLDGKHTVFGRVIEGMDVLTKLTRREPGAGAPPADKIIEAKVLRKRDHKYEFNKLPER